MSDLRAWTESNRQPSASKSDASESPKSFRRIYVASSWRSRLQPTVVSALRRLGHEVYDFRSPAPGESGFGWKECDPEPVPWTGRRLRDVLVHPVARKGYAYDMGALRACDTCVLVLPCGRSAHWELGYAMGQGKRGYVVMFEPDEPELMYSEATILAGADELIGAFARAPTPGVHEPGCTLAGKAPAMGYCLDCEAERANRQRGFASEKG